MKNCTTQLIFSLSLVYMVYSVSSPSSFDKGRNKRSIILDNVLHHRFRWLNQHQDTNKRSAFDALDLGSLLSDPVFHETDAGDNFDGFDYNEMDFNSYPDFTDLPPIENDLPALEKEEMSNVIPGAQGPYDSQPMENSHGSYTPYSYDSSAAAPAFQENAHAHYIAESLMDEFMQFLVMKDMGVLDRCLDYRHRR